ncbi:MULTISPECIES: hypothetical protein [Bacillus]|uniref:hypothetical protein n=1 Tax=Bacillus TaxID=1386 RepID=UPI000300D0AE|nr:MULTISPECIES: hypothetical protein [Bacillus]
MNAKEKKLKDTTKNKNDIKVNNHFSLSINFGDSLNILTLIVGFFIIKSFSKRCKRNKKVLKADKNNE